MNVNNVTIFFFRSFSFVTADIESRVSLLLPIDMQLYAPA